MTVLFCNVAWMKTYTGPDPENMYGGGSFVEKHKTGVEQNNFFDFNGKYKGAVAVLGKGINIERLGAAKKDTSVEDVLVVWVAKHPNSGGVRIVGWYKDARVYRTHQYTKDECIYITETCVENGVLLPVSERVFSVPRASVAGKGRGMGQSPYWFADTPEAQKFVDRTHEYVYSYRGLRANSSISSLDLAKQQKAELTNLETEVGPSWKIIAVGSIVEGELLALLENQEEGVSMEWKLVGSI